MKETAVLSANSYDLNKSNFTTFPEFNQKKGFNNKNNEHLSTKGVVIILKTKKNLI